MIKDNVFEKMMSSGVAAQATGEHEVALRYRQNAVQMAASSTQTGRALRDVSASEFKLGLIPQALQSIEGSEEALAEVGGREYACTLCQHGRLMAAVAIKVELTGDRFGMSEHEVHESTSAADRKIEKGLSMLEKDDQYYKNFVGRLAAVYAVNGRRAKTLKTAFLALPAALTSEVKGGVTSNSNSTKKERLRAKVMHLGVAGLAIGSAFSPSRKLSLKLADKAVG